MTIAQYLISLARSCFSLVGHGAAKTLVFDPSLEQLKAQGICIRLHARHGCCPQQYFVRLVQKVGRLKLKRKKSILLFYPLRAITGCTYRADTEASRCGLISNFSRQLKAIGTTSGEAEALNNALVRPSCLWPGSFIDIYWGRLPRRNIFPKQDSILKLDYRRSVRCATSI